MRLNLCLVNFAYEQEELLEPYEWQEDDLLEWLVGVNVIHVSSCLIKDLYESFITFKGIEDGHYIFGDGKDALAIYIENNHLVKRSKLTFDCLKKVNRWIQDLPLRNIDYLASVEKQNKEYGLTRFEKEKKQLLLTYLDLFDLEDIGIEDEDYLEDGYHLIHEYFYQQILKEDQKKA